MEDRELKVNHDYQTVIGDFPKVGIRPIIDGRRRGVRESLEDQTMNMAKNAAKLITSNLKYPNGKPVECVIADYVYRWGCRSCIMCRKIQEEWCWG